MVQFLILEQQNEQDAYSLAQYEIWVTEENFLLKKVHFWKMSATQWVKTLSKIIEQEE